MRKVLSKLTATGLVLAVSTLAAQESGPSFRAGVELIAVEAQVVDRDGQPLMGLAPNRFEVTVGGQRRTVFSAEFVGTALPGEAGRSAAAHGRPPTMAEPMETGQTSPKSPQTIVIAVDAISFGAHESRSAVVAAQDFIKQIHPADRVALFTFPRGPRINPTVDRAALHRALDDVTGQRPLMAGSPYRLRPAEIIEIAARQSGCNDQFPQAVAKCDATLEPTFAAACNGDSQCRRTLISHAKGIAQEWEHYARTSLSSLGSLMKALTTIPGRKIVILVSAGLIVSDRQGVAPDVGTLPVEIGQEAARANVTLYTLFIDRSFIAVNTADQRSAATTTLAFSRDSGILAQWLEQFTGTAGGALLRVVANNPELAFARIARETSGYYLLGVEPADADRDGKPRQLRIRVNAGRGTTVRARSWVILPAR